MITIRGQSAIIEDALFISTSENIFEHIPRVRPLIYHLSFDCYFKYFIAHGTVNNLAITTYTYIFSCVCNKLLLFSSQTKQYNLKTSQISVAE